MEDPIQSIHPTRPAPDTDNEEHRDQHGLEEQVKQNRIGCREHAVNQTRHDQERRQILRHLLLNHFPRRGDDEDGGEAIEQYKQHGDAVNAQRIVNVVTRDPHSTFNKLHGRAGVVEADPQRDRDQQTKNAADQRHGARHWLLRFLVEEQHQDAGDDRHPDGQTQYVGTCLHCCFLRPMCDSNSHTTTFY